MQSKFPVERQAKRQALLKAVDNVRDILAAHAEETEALRTLAPASVAALRESGLFTLKLPAVLGGAEADPVTQVDVIEAVSYIDPSTGWSLMIGAGGGSFCGFLPEEGIGRIFPDGRIPTFAGAIMPGHATPVDGGYRVDGRWSWASGIRHAEWVAAHVLVENKDGGLPASRIAMIPVAHLQIHDMWNVAGLKGTGSCDFSVTNAFVPEECTFDLQELQPQRGGPLYRLGLPGLLINEFAGFALGVARRALDSIIELVQTKRRGYGPPTRLADRASVQRMIGESDLRLRAVRGFVIELLENAWTIVSEGKALTPQQQVELRSATTMLTDVAVDVATQAFRHGGGTAIHLNNILQKCFRDMQVGAAHLAVSDSTYELHGQCLLGVTDVNPMG
jgi:alkylation response protein AidB-like acyl-CoA dehydrogenase